MIIMVMILFLPYTNMHSGNCYRCLLARAKKKMTFVFVENFSGTRVNIAKTHGLWSTQLICNYIVPSQFIIDNKIIFSYL